MPKPDPAKRQQWEAHLKAWEHSGLSEAKWCLERTKGDRIATCSFFAPEPSKN